MSNEERRSSSKSLSQSLTSSNVSGSSSTNSSYKLINKVSYKGPTKAERTEKKISKELKLSGSSPTAMTRKFASNLDMGSKDSIITAVEDDTKTAESESKKSKENSESRASRSHNHKMHKIIKKPDSEFERNPKKFPDTDSRLQLSNKKSRKVSFPPSNKVPERKSLAKNKAKNLLYGPNSKQDKRKRGKQNGRQHFPSSKTSLGLHSSSKTSSGSTSTLNTIKRSSIINRRRRRKKENRNRNEKLNGLKSVELSTNKKSESRGKRGQYRLQHHGRKGERSSHDEKKSLESSVASTDEN